MLLAPCAYNWHTRYMQTLTIQERKYNRDLYEYVSHIRCERCPMVLVDDDPKEWEADRQAKGVCSKCRKRSLPVSYYGVVLESMSFDTNTWVADWRTMPHD